MITLSELYFLNSDWNSDVVITIAIEGEFHYIQGNNILSCDFHDCIVSGFSNNLVIVKRRGGGK